MEKEKINQEFRIEEDSLGKLKIPKDTYWGIHTQRALDNFKFSNYKIPFILIKAYAYVKLACAKANYKLGYLKKDKFKAIEQACKDIIDGKLKDAFPLDPFQGGAGTSLNMNLNEVIANRALEILGYEKGRYDIIHPLKHVNLHQSTNDTFPTALKIAVLFLLEKLQDKIAKLQGAFQKKEKEFSDILKLGYTELQEAIPMTLGKKFSAFADVLLRDRWRIWKAKERIRWTNLGGTAIGTGALAPKDYIFLVNEILREITNLNLARHENPVSTTAFLDDINEVVGLLDVYASNLNKIFNDLRLLNFIKEIKLSSLQAGSSIMPGKVNPVLCEAAIQIATRVKSNSLSIRELLSFSTFEIVEFLPAISFFIIESLELLTNLTEKLISYVENIKVGDLSEENVFKSFSCLTLLVPILGYEKTLKLVKEYKQSEFKNIKEFLEYKFGKEFTKKLLSKKYILSLGFDKKIFESFEEKNE